MYVTTADGMVHNMHCMLLLTSVDLPACALIWQFTGRYGDCFAMMTTQPVQEMHYIGSGHQDLLAQVYAHINHFLTMLERQPILAHWYLTNKNKLRVDSL